MKTHKAAVYREFRGPITVESIPYPTLPSDGVIIQGELCLRRGDVGCELTSHPQVMATGVCRSDWHGWAGHDGDIHNHRLPFVPGHEVSGIVVEVGEEG